jgi:hypothetical protein
MINLKKRESFLSSIKQIYKQIKFLLLIASKFIFLNIMSTSSNA